MSNPNTTGLLGSDNVAPIYQPDSRWCWWNLNEIYSWTTNGLDGNLNHPVGANKYVPKINDYVLDTVNNVTYAVVDMNVTTLAVTLKEVVINTSGNFTNNDVLLGINPNTNTDTYRVYLDKSVLPYSLAVDARLKVAGSLTSYCKIFLGSDISSTGVVISRLYDQSGNFISENIPLEVVTYDSYVDPNGATVTVNNNSIKIVSVCYTQYDLQNGELVTAVFYNAQAGVVSKRQLLIENTGFIRTLNANQKYITGISLETPFMSQTGSNEILYPMNLPVNAMSLIGVVNYSDGSRIKLPVDGTKFSMLGINQYLSTIIGQKINLVLSYKLSPIETVVGAITSDGKFVTQPYNLVTLPVDNVYNVKLFGYPKFVSNAEGYVMVWYLYNLDRNVVFDVTNMVRFNANTGAFRPTLFGNTQRLSVNINLKDVSGNYKSFVHAQTVEVTLYDLPSNLTTSWTVAYEANQNPAYGANLFATVKNLALGSHQIDLSASFNFAPTLSLADKFNIFIDKMVTATKPLYNVNKELSYPMPTNFTIVANGTEQDYLISSWNSPLAFTNVINEYDTIIVKFYKQTPTGRIHISAAGIEARFI
jgi:hypothetical protein